VEEISVTVEKIVIPENHRWVIAIPVPIEVEEMIYAPAALNPKSISWKNTLLKIVATQITPSSSKVKILGFNALKDRKEILRVV
jgi:ABC-type phosphate/phosphonate transport system ATPase subunit